MTSTVPGGSSSGSPSSVASRFVLAPMRSHSLAPRKSVESPWARIASGEREVPGQRNEENLLPRRHAGVAEEAAAENNAVGDEASEPTGALVPAGVVLETSRATGSGQCSRGVAGV